MTLLLYPDCQHQSTAALRTMQPAEEIRVFLAALMTLLAIPLGVSVLGGVVVLACLRAAGLADQALERFAESPVYPPLDLETGESLTASRSLQWRRCIRRESSNTPH